jgi:integrase
MEKVDLQSRQASVRRRGDGRIFSHAASSYLWCAYFLRGKEFRESTKTADPDKAAKFLKRRLKEVGADQIGKAAFVGPQQERIKVGELLDALEEDYKLRDKVNPQFRAHLKHIREYFAGWRAVEVSPEAVDRFISARKQLGNAPATINRSTQLLAQAFRLAVERGHLSSVPQIRHLSEKGNARQGFFTDGEFRNLKTTLPVYLQDFFEFGYLTGWRKGEIASLCWSDVEGDLVRLRGFNSKNGEARSVVLTGDLAQLIERRRDDRQVKSKAGVLLTAHVFHLNGEPVGDFRKAWGTACAAAGLGQFVCDRCERPVASRWCEECKCEARYAGRIFHDLRRTAVRNMVRAGVPERVAMAISGHKTRAIFDRYNIVNEADLHEAMQRIQAYLRENGQQQNRAAVMEIRSG